MAFFSLYVWLSAIILSTTTPVDAAEDTYLDHNLPVRYFWAEIIATFVDPETNETKTERFKGKFGHKSLVESRINGTLFHARTKTDNQTHGCEEYGGDIPSGHWIALVERGTCYFEDKILVATEKHNASAIVIYNSDDTGFTIMQHFGKLFLAVIN